MKPEELDRLLQRIDEGVATPEEQARVEEFLNEAEQTALIAEAVRDEAGTVEMADDVALFTNDAWISAMLDHELDARTHRLAARHLMASGAGTRMTAMAEVGHTLREAIAEQSGEVDLWNDVAHELGVASPEAIPGWDGALLAEAVRAEAGNVDVADEVVRRVRRSALAVPPAAVPVPANSARRWIGGLALAATVMLGVLVGREALQGPEPAAFDIQFASADEIAITDLAYAEDANVTVFQGGDDNAPLIIWIDDTEEAHL